jgi:GTP-binding protein
MAYKIKNADYIISAPKLELCPEWALPEVALLGRSNVGKSSFINAFTHRKKLAHTSNTPGKTRLMNFYDINHEFAFVDLPGYGYAKVSKTEQAEWRRQFERYLVKRDNLKLVIQLIDARHGLMQADIQMMDWLSQTQCDGIMVLTKADKISKNELQKMIVTVAKQLEVEPEVLFGFSAQSGYGVDAIQKFVIGFLQAHRAGDRITE